MASRTPTLWYYKIVTDVGCAPNVLDGYLTLALCKPLIRKAAVPGDYVLAFITLQKLPMTNTLRNQRVAYLFKVTDRVTMLEYEDWCTKHACRKVCTANSMIGDCQYNAKGVWRPGPHSENHRNRNVGKGVNALISTYYAAWKTPELEGSKKLLTPGQLLQTKYLTVDQIKSIGLTMDDVKTLGIGHKYTSLTPENIIALNGLIDEWRKSQVPNVPTPVVPEPKANVAVAATNAPKKESPKEEEVLVESAAAAVVSQPKSCCSAPPKKKAGNTTLKRNERSSARKSMRRRTSKRNNF
jgi:hypothetical protein